MLELLEDKKVWNLIERIMRVECHGQDMEFSENGKTVTRHCSYYPDGSVYAAGYNKLGFIVFLPYADQKEFNERFFNHDKSQLNGCAVARIHGGIAYKVFLDSQSTGKTGEWRIEGRDEWNNTIDARFQTREDFLNGRMDVYKKISGYAVVNQVGTKVYFLVEVEKLKAQ